VLVPGVQEKAEFQRTGHAGSSVAYGAADDTVGQRLAGIGISGQNREAEGLPEEAVRADGR
jgi:hypothetical protein